MKRAEATFGMGCFWKPDILFAKVEGVIETEVGYMGGDESKYGNPTYKQVCSDRTGHAEVVHIVYDPSKVSYGELLDVFWQNHDPTQKNRQGLDIGSQYNSMIFYHSENQKIEAERSNKQFQEKYRDKKIETQIVKAGPFHKAEEYHQKYLEKNTGAVC